MLKGSQGQKYRTDAIGMLVMIAQIATSEIEDNEKTAVVSFRKTIVKLCIQLLLPQKELEIAQKTVI